MNTTRSGSFWPLAILLLVTLANGLLWSGLLPFDTGNDEALHFQVARFIAREGRLPVYGADEGMYIGYDEFGRPRSSYALHPSLPYLVAATLMRVIPGEAFADDLHAARMATVATALGVVLVAHRLAALLFPDQPFLRLALPVLVAFQPTFGFVTSYVTNDGLTILASSLLVCVAAQQVLRPGRAPVLNALLLGAGIGLLLLTKFNAYLLLPFALAGYTWSLRNRPATLLVGLGVAALVALVIAGWWFARNVAVYNGDLLARSAEKLAWAQEVPGWRPFIERGYSVPELAYIAFFWWYYTFRTFWAAFGKPYELIGPDQVFYTGFVLLTAASMVGVRYTVPSVLAQLRHSATRPRAVLLSGFFVYAVALAAFSFVNSFVNEFQPQGRYLFPALLPISVMLLMGLTQFRVRSWKPGWVALAGTLYAMGVSLSGPLWYVWTGHYGGWGTLLTGAVYGAEGESGWLLPYWAIFVLSAISLLGSALLAWLLVQRFREAPASAQDPRRASPLTAGSAR